MTAGTAAAAAGTGAAAVPVLAVTCYTDPLCCWSWALEPHLARLRREFGPWLAWRTRMGGMIPDWERYRDPINAIARPSQMGPVWMETRHLTGAVLDERIWIEDPPDSSWPACLAVKAAGLQSEEAADAYLRRLRQAVMTERRNIARRAVLLELAAELAAERPDLLDPERLARDLESDAAQAAFRDDLKEGRYRGIGRFPALTLGRLDTGRGVVLVGYRPYAALRAALLKAAPELDRSE